MPHLRAVVNKGELGNDDEANMENFKDLQTTVI